MTSTLLTKMELVNIKYEQFMEGFYMVGSFWDCFLSFLVIFMTNFFLCSFLEEGNLTILTLSCYVNVLATVFLLFHWMMKVYRQWSYHYFTRESEEFDIVSSEVIKIPPEFPMYNNFPVHLGGDKTMIISGDPDGICKYINHEGKPWALRLYIYIGDPTLLLGFNVAITSTFDLVLVRTGVHIYDVHHIAMQCILHHAILVSRVNFSSLRIHVCDEEGLCCDDLNLMKMHIAMYILYYMRCEQLWKLLGKKKSERIVEFQTVCPGENYEDHLPSHNPMSVFNLSDCCDGNDTLVREYYCIQAEEKNSREYKGMKLFKFLPVTKHHVQLVAFLSIPFLKQVEASLSQEEYNRSRFNYFSAIFSFISLAIFFLKYALESMPEIVRIIETLKMQKTKKKKKFRKTQSYDDLESALAFTRESEVIRTETFVSQDFTNSLISPSCDKLIIGSCSFFSHLGLLFSVNEITSAFKRGIVYTAAGTYFYNLAASIGMQAQIVSLVEQILQKTKRSIGRLAINRKEEVKSFFKRESAEPINPDLVGEAIHSSYNTAKRMFSKLFVKEVSAIFAIAVIAVNTPPGSQKENLRYLTDECRNILVEKGCTLDTIVDMIAHYAVVFTTALFVGRVDYNFFSEDKNNSVEFYEIKSVIDRVPSGAYTVTDGGDLLDLKKRVVRLKRKLDLELKVCHSPMKKAIHGQNLVLVSAWLHTINEKISESSDNVPPIALLLYGGAGVGKTFLISAISKYVHQLLKISDIEKVSPMNSADKYDSNLFMDSTCIVLDDFGHVDSSTNLSAPDPKQQILRFYSSVKTTAVKAGVADKGNIFLAPELLIMTSNLPDCRLTQGSPEPGAMYRRLGLKIEVLLKPEFADKNGRLDTTKVKEHGTFPDFLMYQRYELESERAPTFSVKVEEPPMNSRQFAACLKDHVEKELAIRKVAERSRAVKHTCVVCDVCFMPGDYCECVKKEEVVDAIVKQVLRKKEAEEVCNEAESAFNEEMSEDFRRNTDEDFSSEVPDQFMSLEEHRERCRVNPSIVKIDDSLAALEMSCEGNSWVTSYFGMLLGPTMINVCSTHISQQLLIWFLDYFYYFPFLISFTIFPVITLFAISLSSLFEYFGHRWLRDKMKSLREVGGLKYRFYRYMFIRRTLSKFFPYIVLCITFSRLIPLCAVCFVLEKFFKPLLFDVVQNMLLQGMQGYVHSVLDKRNKFFLLSDRSKILLGVLAGGTTAWATYKFLRSQYSRLLPEGAFIETIEEQKKELTEPKNWIPPVKVKASLSHASRSTTEETLCSLLKENTYSVMVMHSGVGSLQHIICLNTSFAMCAAHAFYTSEGKTSDLYNMVVTTEHSEVKIQIHRSMIWTDVERDIAIFPFQRKMAKDIVKFLPVSLESKGIIFVKRMTQNKVFESLSGKFEPVMYPFHNSRTVSYMGIKVELKEMTKNGLCGLPIVSVNNGAYIAGFHVAGNKNQWSSFAVFTPVYIGDYEQAMNMLQDVHVETPEFQDLNFVGMPSPPMTEVVHAKNVVNWCPVELQIVGNVQKDFTMKSKVMKTSFEDLIRENFKVSTEFVAPNMKPSLVYRKPVLIGNSPTPAMDMNILGKSVEDYCSVIPCLAQVYGYRRPYTLEEILNGCLATGLSTIKSSTSAGWPFQKKKSLILEGSPGEWNLTKEQVLGYHETLKRVEDNVHCGLVFNAIPKDEPKPLGKEIARAFYSCPLYLNIICAQYLNPAMEFMNTFPSEFEIALGVDSHTTQWHELMAKFYEPSIHDLNVWASDYSCYDLTQSHFLRSAAGKVFTTILECLGYSEKDKAISLKLIGQILSPLINFGGSIVSCDKIMPSGINITAHGNSIVGALINRCVYYECVPDEQRPYRMLFYDVHLGDDNISRVTDYVDRAKWNPDFFMKKVEEYGLSATSPSKKEGVGYLKNEDCEFLKRYTIYHDDLGYLVGALMKNSIFRPLLIYIPTKGQTVSEHFSEIFRNVLNESVMWGRDFFDDVHGKLYDLSSHDDIQVPWDSLLNEDYDTRISRYKQHNISYECPPLATRLSCWTRESEEVSGSTEVDLGIAKALVAGDDVVSDGNRFGSFTNPVESKTELVNWWDRPVATRRINFSLNTFKTYDSNPYAEIMIDPLIADKMRNMSAIRFDVEATIQFSRAYGIYGEVWLIWLPLDSHIGFQRDIVQSGLNERMAKAHYSHYPHIKIDLSSDNMSQMNINWCSPYPMTNRFEDIDMGRLKIVCWKGVRTINAVGTPEITAQLYYRMKNVHIGGATASTEAQYFPCEKLSDTLFKVSDTAQAASSIMRGVPALAVPSEMISMASRIGGNIIQAFGYSRPRQVSSQEVVVGHSVGSTATYNSVTTARTLALDEFNQTTIDPTITGLDMEDPFLISSLAKRGTHIANLTWVATDAVETTLFSVEVSPSKVITYGNKVYFPPIAYAASNFTSYSGGVYCYGFKAIKHSTFGGVLSLSYEPLGELPMSGGRTTNRTLTWDIRAEDEIVFKIGWNSTRSALLVNGDVFVDFTERLGLDYSIGTLSLRVDTPLIGAGNAPPTTYINVNFWMSEPPVFFNYDSSILDSYRIMMSDGKAAIISDSGKVLSQENNVDVPYRGEGIGLPTRQTRFATRTPLKPANPLGVQPTASMPTAPVSAPIWSSLAPKSVPVTAPVPKSVPVTAPVPKSVPIAAPVVAPIIVAPTSANVYVDPWTGATCPLATFFGAKPITSCQINGSFEETKNLEASTSPLFRYMRRLTVCDLTTYVDVDLGQQAVIALICYGSYAVDETVGGVSQQCVGIPPVSPMVINPTLKTFYSTCTKKGEIKIGIAFITETPVFGVICSIRAGKVYSHVSIDKNFITVGTRSTRIFGTLTIPVQILGLTDVYVIPNAFLHPGLSITFVGTCTIVNNATGVVVVTGTGDPGVVSFTAVGGVTYAIKNCQCSIMWLRTIYPWPTNSVLGNYTREAAEFSVLPSGVSQDSVIRLQAGENICSLRNLLKIFSSPTIVVDQTHNTTIALDQYLSPHDTLCSMWNMCIGSCIGVTGSVVYLIQMYTGDVLYVSNRTAKLDSNWFNHGFEISRARNYGTYQFENPSYNHELFSLPRGRLFSTTTNGVPTLVPKFGKDGTTQVPQGIKISCINFEEGSSANYHVFRCAGESFNASGFLGFPIVIHLDR